MPILFADFAGFTEFVRKHDPEVVRVALQLLEGEPADVVELLACDFIQDRLKVFDLAALEPLVSLQHLIFGRLQNAVQPR